jgi:hypothetical protein
VAIKGAKHGPRPPYTLKKGESLCFACLIEDYCDDGDKRCLWRRYRVTKKLIHEFCKGMEVA